MAFRLGRLTLGITLGHGAFEESSKKVSRSFNRMIRNVRRESKAANLAIGGIVSTLRGMRSVASFAVKGLAAGLGVAGAALGGFIALVSKATNDLDAMGKAAGRAGTDAETLQVYRLLADRAGVSLQSINTVLQRVTRRLGDAARGSTTLRKAFKDLGVSVFDQYGKIRNLRDVLPELAEAFRNIESDAKAASLAGTLFDVEGIPFVMNALRKLGKDGIRFAADEFRRLGLIIDNETVAAAERAKDRFTVLGDTMRARFLAVLGQFAPALGIIAETIAQVVAPRIKEFGKGLDDISTGKLPALVAAVFRFAEAMVRAFAGIGNAVVWLVQAIGKLADALRKIVQVAGLLPGISLQITHAMSAALKEVRDLGKGMGDMPTEEWVAKLHAWRDEFQRVLAQVMRAEKEADAASAQPGPDPTPGGDTGSGPGKAPNTFVRNVKEEALIAGQYLIELQKKAKAAADKARAEQERVMAEHRRRVEAFADSWANALGQAFSAPTVKAGIRGLGESIRTALMNAVLRGIAMGLAQSIVKRSIMDDGGFLTGAAKFTRKLFGFRYGGLARVAGSGGPDSQLVQFMATPGERVRVEPPGRSPAAAGAGMTLNQTVNFHLLTREGMEEAALQAVMNNDEALALRFATITQSAMTGDRSFSR